VLVPLSIGYYVGGSYKITKDGSIRKRLARNVCISASILVIGLSYIWLKIFFGMLTNAGITNLILQTTLYAICFLVYPVFLLGQTVPLVSNYFFRFRMAEATGKMLFFSTFGSFMGAILSTLVLMAFVGVHHTVVITIGLLCFLLLLLSKEPFSKQNFTAALIFFTAFLFNNYELIRLDKIVENNQYSTIRVLEEDQGRSRVLSINHSTSAKISDEPALMHKYARYMEKRFTAPLTEKNGCPCEVLIVGAGGFIIGLDDSLNHYTYIDIDDSLERVAEKDFLKKPLGENKTFLAKEARAFLSQTQEKYDLIVLDAYTNTYTTPAHLITADFFKDVKAHLKPHGVVAFNVITRGDFSNDYALKLDNTFRSVFPHYNRELVIDEQREFTRDTIFNVIYSYYHTPAIEGGYTDNLNDYFMDK
jgi:spermidine synthase